MDMDKHSLPLVTARDVYVDDVTSDLPVVRIEARSSMGEPSVETAFRLAPCACRALGIALTAAADIAERDVYGRVEEEAKPKHGMTVAIRKEVERKLAESPEWSPPAWIVQAALDGMAPEELTRRLGLERAERVLRAQQRAEPGIQIQGLGEALHATSLPVVRVTTIPDYVGDDAAAEQSGGAR